MKVEEVFASVSQDLTLVNKKIEQELVIKGIRLDSFVNLDVCPFNSLLRPGLVILTARFFNYTGGKAIALACIFQLVYLASRIHTWVLEPDEISPSNKINFRDGSQFPVLVGDYLYGKFFTFLCKKGLIDFLKPIAEIICSINEGGILRQMAAKKLHTFSRQDEIIRKEKAELIAGCCSCGAMLGRALVHEQSAITDFGLNLGMAYGLLEQDAPFKRVVIYLKNALEKLAVLPERPEKEVLRQLVYLFLRREVVLQRMVG